MAKTEHELRDPIHGFIRFSSHERSLLNARPFQRLRHIHQLALTYLVYPGATHRRFEHSLGVMELATRAFDEIVAEQHIVSGVSERLPEIADRGYHSYWRQILRLAALCHDIGHLPFSHAAESLLPDGKKHEFLTKLLIESDEMMALWKGFQINPRPEDIVKLALGPKEYPEGKFSDWEVILSEIITGDALGTDRMDYLLRDAYHTGVTYGRFDHLRLLQGLRVVLKPSEDGSEVSPSLGIEEGALAGAESLLVARQFMYTQVYHHHVRLAYNLHLEDFLREWLPGGKFEMTAEGHLALTDNEVLAGMAKSLREGGPGSGAADRILNRKHFKRIHRFSHVEQAAGGVTLLEAAEAKLKEKFGAANVRSNRKEVKGGRSEFPVLRGNGEITSSLKISKILPNLPSEVLEDLLVEPSIRDSALAFLQESLKDRAPITPLFPSFQS